MPFCNLLETQNFTAEPFEAGIVSASGVEASFKAFTIALAELDYDSIPGDPDDPVQDMSWMWQYCSEYGESSLILTASWSSYTDFGLKGFYQRGDSDNPLSIETSFLSLELFQSQCNETFPEGLPASPAVDHVNKYGGWLMTPSNVLFTNGECKL